ncbi:hypothetical protein OsccyDRAFT_1156 [Leptolyngbyaceae cyanobacterium JSC-12]|nr:hypothetical protein OsccyDRAFT_1156 [Leptolyngbyaceae cyanobacterium JSC-12]
MPCKLGEIAFTPEVQATQSKCSSRAKGQTNDESPVFTEPFKSKEEHNLLPKHAFYLSETSQVRGHAA